MFKKFFTYLLFVSLIIFCSCGTSEKKDKEYYDRYKPESKGGSTDILVIISPELWSGEVGETVRESLGGFIPGLPRRERNFKLIPIKPSKFRRLLTRHHSVLFVTSLKDESSEGRQIKRFFTDNTLQNFEKSNKFMIGKNNVFAKGQKILYLFSNDSPSLINNLIKKQNEIIDYFKLHHLARLETKFLESSFMNEKLNEYIAKETGIDMKITNSFLTAKKDSNFLWLRQKEKIDMSITVSYGKYESQEQFEEENIIKWRNHFGFKSLNDESIKDSYMYTQDKQVPVVSRKTNINGLFAKEYRGMWKLKNGSQGGPFLGYAFVDEKKKRFYYVEGFLFAPSVDKKRDYMFKLEAMLRSIKLLKDKK